MPATSPPPSKNNATAARFYSMKSQGQGDVNLWNLDREEKNAEEADAKATLRAHALKKALDNLHEATKSAQEDIEKLNDIMSQENSKLNASDLALAGAAALATVAGLAAAIAGAPIIAVGASVALVVISYEGSSNDSQRQKQPTTFAQDAKELIGGVKDNALDVAQTGKDVVDVLKNVEPVVSTAGKVASATTSFAGGALTTYERLEASETESYQLPDLPNDGPVDDYEEQLYNYSPTDNEEKAGFTTEARDNAKKKIDEMKKARAAYQKALAAYGSARSIAAMETATYVATLSKLSPKK